jgi:hypothetical protein
MNILKPIFNAYQKAQDRSWDTIYWAIDVHSTMIVSNYDKDAEDEFYPYCKKVLRLLTEKKHIKLILYTCSYEESMKKFMEILEEEGIVFDFFNENPEAMDTNYGSYTKKPYFNVLLEDKGGFEPEKDWEEIYNYLMKNIDVLEKFIK